MANKIRMACTAAALVPLALLAACGSSGGSSTYCFVVVARRERFL